MVTTRRSTVVMNNSFENATNKGGVSLLERPETCDEGSIEKNSDVSQSERMQQNLQKLLNYDRFNEENMQQTVVDEAVKDFAEEDIRPTSTTMQFGDENLEQIREDMKVNVIEETSYRLNTKGKIVVMLYSLVVTVILALIVLNTGILSRLSQTETAMANSVNTKVAEYNALMSEIDSISSPDYIIESAQNLGMSKGN